MNSSSNQELEENFAYHFEDNQPPVKLYDETDDDGRFITAPSSSRISEFRSAVPGDEDAEHLERKSVTPTPQTPRAKSDNNNGQPYSRGHSQAASESKAVRALVPKSFVSNLPVAPTPSQRQLPAQSVVKRTQQLTYTPNPQQPLTFYIGKQQIPTAHIQEVSDMPESYKHNIGGGRPWRIIPAKSPSSTFSNFNKTNILEQQSSTSSVNISNHFASSLDQQQQDLLGMRSGKYDRIEPTFLQISKWGASGGVANSIDTALAPPKSRKSDRERFADSFRIHLKDPHLTFQQLISASKQSQMHDQRKTPNAMLSQSRASHRGVQQPSGRPTISRLAVIGGQRLDFNIGNSEQLSFKPAGQDTFKVVGAGTGAVTSRTAVSSQNNLRSSLDESYISGKALPFSNLLPKIVPSQAAAPVVKQLTVVKAGEDCYHLIGFDHRDLLRRVPEKNPHFAVMPTVLNSTAFKSAESRNFPIRTVSSPRPSSNNTMSTVAI